MDSLKAIKWHKFENQLLYQCFPHYCYKLAEEKDDKEFKVSTISDFCHFKVFNTTPAMV